MRGLSALLFAAFAITSLASADSFEDCPTVRLDAPGGSMEGITPITQKNGREDTGTCTYFALTTVFDAFRKTQLPKDQPFHRSSPLAAAVEDAAHQHRQYDLDPPAETETRLVADTRLRVSLIGNGTCDAEALWGKNAEQSDIGASETALFYRLQEAYRRYETRLWSESARQTAMSPIETISDPILDAIISEGLDHEGVQKRMLENRGKIAEQFAGELTCKLIQENLMPWSDDQSQSIASFSKITAQALLEGKDPLSFVNSLIQKRCDGHRLHIPTAANSNTVTIHSPTEVVESYDFLQKRFRKADAQPVALAVCSAILTRDDQPCQVLRTRVAKDTYAADCYKNAGHMLVVMGQRWNPERKTCEYLIQDSYDTAAKPNFNRYTTRDSRNKYWIDAHYLMNNALDMQYITPNH